MSGPDRSQIAKIRGVVFDCDIAKSITQTDAPKLKDARDKIDNALKSAASGFFNTAVPRIIDNSRQWRAWFPLPAGTVGCDA